MTETLQRDLTFLRESAEDILRRCTVRKRTAYFGPKEETELLIPGGDDKYPSFWLRDCCMNCLSGLVPPEAMRRYLSIIALCGQNGAQPLALENGLMVPPWDMADHVNYNGRPVWYPGTYRDGSDQGDGTFGIYPPLDDSFWVAQLAEKYIELTGDDSFLDRELAGIPLITRLDRAFESPFVDPESGLMTAREPDYAIDWGFTDTILKTGKLLFSSLLRHNAARGLGVLHARRGENAAAERYQRIAEQLRGEICRTFPDGSGWLLAATGRCRQRDVWGTLYAIWSGVLTEPLRERALDAVLAAWRDGEQMAVHGYVRQILLREDVEPGVRAWERTVFHPTHNAYQNGGYWATPTGWLFWALYLRDPEAAFRAISDYCDHTRQYADQGAPFEWIDRNTEDRSGLWYGTSAALTYEAVLRIAAEEDK